MPPGLSMLVRGEIGPYWYDAVPSMPSSARNVALLIDPPAVKGAENRLLPLAGVGLEKTPR